MNVSAGCAAALRPPWPALVQASARHDLSTTVNPLSGLGRCDEPSLLAAGVAPRVVERLGRVGPWSGTWLRAIDDEWPRQLRGVPYGPVALDLEGCPVHLHAPLVAIVGARACSGEARLRAARLAGDVVDAGGVVLSGGAWGVDAEAHAAARGATVAVLGQGLRAPMAGWQARLCRDVLLRGGLLVSEMAPRAPAQAWTFPVRNRILAALAHVVVVVEAGERSGARITARLALEMGREVMVVPGSPGCDAMLAEGAPEVRGGACVVAALARSWSVRGAPA